MALKVAVQMDPIERVAIAGDTTFALMLEAAARGHALHYYRPEDLSLREGSVSAYAAPLQVRAELGNHFALGEAAPGAPVLIDTAGINPFEAAEAEALTALIAAAGASPVLVMQAGAHPEEAAEQAAVFAALAAVVVVLALAMPRYDRVSAKPLLLPNGD